MGAITKAQQEIQQGKPATFADLVKKVSPQFQAVMPKGFKAERLAQMAISAYNQTPKLAECSVPSILSCCLRCASLGLEPSAVDGMGRAYILPYKNRKTGAMEAQFILGKNGMVELVQRSQLVKSLRTQCVYEGDEFDYWEVASGDIELANACAATTTFVMGSTQPHAVAHFKKVAAPTPVPDQTPAGPASSVTPASDKSGVAASK